jgi:hypothetical protein
MGRGGKIPDGSMGCQAIWREGPLEAWGGEWPAVTADPGPGR